MHTSFSVSESHNPHRCIPASDGEMSRAASPCDFLARYVEVTNPETRFRTSLQLLDNWRAIGRRSVSGHRYLPAGRGCRDSCESNPHDAWPCGGLLHSPSTADQRLMNHCWTLMCHWPPAVDSRGLKTQRRPTAAQSGCDLRRGGLRMYRR